MANELSFVIVKPDGLHRGLVGEVIARFEKKGLKLRGLKLIKITPAQAEKQYQCHKGKAFYDKLVKFMTSGPSVVMVLEGNNSLKVVRRVVGVTDPTLAEPGTLRGDFSLDITQNIVHASDSPESCAFEWPIYFSPQELAEYDLCLKPLISSSL